jgi:hypothetical protein
MKLILLLTIVAITFAGAMTLAPNAESGVLALKVASHCAPGERVVYSCPTTNSKLISLCSSSTLTSSEGYLQYRFGPAGKPELIYPATREHPSKHFQLGGIMYSGGGGAYLKFVNGEYTYKVFSYINSSGEAAGVVVSKSGKRIAELYCKDDSRRAIIDLGLSQSGIPEDPNKYGFDDP